MPTSFKFYHDSALTSENTALNPFTAVQDTTGSSPVVDTLFYFGSTLASVKAQVASNPGVTAITVSVSDSAPGSGSPTTEIKLATSLIGLDSATAGAALTLSTQVLSGVPNAVPIYMRRDSAITTAGAYTDITLVTQNLIETAV